MTRARRRQLTRDDLYYQRFSSGLSRATTGRDAPSSTCDWSRTGHLYCCATVRRRLRASAKRDALPARTPRLALRLATLLARTRDVSKTHGATPTTRARPEAKRYNSRSNVERRRLYPSTATADGTVERDERNSTPTRATHASLNASAYYYS